MNFNFIQLSEETFTFRPTTQPEQAAARKYFKVAKIKISTVAANGKKKIFSVTIINLKT